MCIRLKNEKLQFIILSYIKNCFVSTFAYKRTFTYYDIEYSHC